MGRWAQRRRAGASNTAAASTTGGQIASASITGTGQARVVYTTPVTAAAFDETTFTSSPSGLPGDSVAQFNATTINVEFDGSILADTSIVYNGSVGGLKSPDAATY